MTRIPILDDNDDHKFGLDNAKLLKINNWNNYETLLILLYHFSSLIFPTHSIYFYNDYVF